MNEEIILRWVQSVPFITKTVRDRIMNYGPDSTRLLLRAYDDLGKLVREAREARDGSEDKD